MIPKKIHYVWVGNTEKPRLVQECIKSWKVFCPDYEIIEWNNESLRLINNEYVSEAFNAKKWAFVSDFLRLYALYHEGGFYLDTDLELTACIDQFRHCQYLTGYEMSSQGMLHPLTALMGAEQHNRYIKKLLSEYSNIHFIQNGEMDLTTNVMRVERFMRSEYNLKPIDFSNDEILEFEKGHFIYPSFYFCAPIEGKEDYSIHHFLGSWLEPYTRKTVVEFSFSKSVFRLIRFRKRSGASCEYSYDQGEYKLFTIPWFNNREYVITFKRYRAN